MNISLDFKSIIFSLIAFSISMTLAAQQSSIMINEDSRIPKMLEIQKNLEKENRLSIGFTIQIYYGELSKANEILEKYQQNYTDWPASIEYETPNYKVWVGNFNTRIEAERVLLLLKKEFSAAFILKPDRKK